MAMTIDRYLDAVRTLNDSGRRYAIEATRTQWVGTIFAADGITPSGLRKGRTREDALIQLADYWQWCLNTEAAR